LHHDNISDGRLNSGCFEDGFVSVSECCFKSGIYSKACDLNLGYEFYHFSSEFGCGGVDVLAFNLCVLNFILIGIWKRNRSKLEKLNFMPSVAKDFLLEICLHFHLDFRSLGEEIVT